MTGDKGVMPAVGNCLGSGESTQPFKRSLQGQRSRKQRDRQRRENKNNLLNFESDVRGSMLRDQNKLGALYAGMSFCCSF